MVADESVFMLVPEKKWRLGFWSLIATQFQGAFNENALKFLVIYLILAVEKDKAQRDQMELLVGVLFAAPDRKSTRLNSSHLGISYAVFCLKKKKNTS